MLNTNSVLSHLIYYIIYNLKYIIINSYLKNNILIKMKNLLFLISFLALQISAKDLNQSVLLQIYGYSFDTVRIDLSQQSIDYIEINTFKDFKKL